MKPAAFRCYPGGASHVVGLAAADEALDEVSTPLGYAGASAGALVAIARAFGVRHARIREAITALVQGNRVLDVSFVIGDGGIYGWNVIPAVVDSLVGKGKKLGEASKRLVVVVTDLDAGAPIYFDSANPAHANVLVSELARATSAIPGVAPQVRIPSFGAGLYSPGIKLHADGGTCDNTADHVFDGEAAPRIALRLVGPQELPTRVRYGDPLTQALAVFRSVLWSSSQIKSRRIDGVVVDIPTVGSGFDFDVSVDEQKRRRDLATAAVKARRADIIALRSAP